MNEVAERNFSNFEFDDNVYKLANGLIPKIAEELHVDIADEPNSEDMQSIMNQVGPNKVLRANSEVAIDRDKIVDFVDQSGVQEDIDRSLLDPRIKLTGSITKLVVVGGMANWQDRSEKIAAGLPGDVPVHVLAGTRPMDTPTELVNRNIVRLRERFGRVPTEAEYAGSVITPRLVAAGLDVLVTPFDSRNGDEMFVKLFEQNRGLLDTRVGLVRVANAGIIMAIQMRDAARKVQKEDEQRKDRPAFDSDKSNPQIYVTTDHFRTAKTDEQEKDAAHYQKSATALRQVVLTAKKLHETRA